MSPKWWQLDEIGEAFGAHLRPHDVSDVIDLRDLLTHRRGELATKELADRYDTREYDFPDGWVCLPVDSVMQHLDTLAAAVERVDKVMYPWAWGSNEMPGEIAEALQRVAPAIDGPA